jgi:acetyltransferase-like isoleucine patch superfamily enzyme/2-polyprenyl-3-methyl-5-hydroxy-6-metoxy-1,4-benzoquinol methylase
MEMKKLFDKIIKKLIRRYLPYISAEMGKEEKKRASRLFNSIKNKDRDSYFWGKELIISDPSKVVIGKNVHIGNNAFIKSDGGLTIGDNTHISRNLTLYTVNHNYASDILPYNSEMIFKKVIIGKNVWIGMNVCITPGTIIGDGAIIGMGTVVSGYVPPLAIVGSQKWRILGERDKKHYHDILKRNRFAKENGLLYTSNDFILQNFGDVYVNQRTNLEKIYYKGMSAVKKTWENNEEALAAFANEKARYYQFHEFSWLPQLFEEGENYIITEFFDNRYRLDQIDLSQKTSDDKQKILGDIMMCVLDMYGENVAHCDIHSKNIFVTPKGIKIIDFEASQQLTQVVDFFESYDIVGRGLASPFKTNHCCVLAPHAYSLKSVFKIKDSDHLQNWFQDFLKQELLTISNTFFTRKNSSDGRHTLKNKLIYSTFDLPHLKIEIPLAQRDIKKRLQRFKVSRNQIQGKTVLDIGSNIGSVLLEIMKYGPIKAVGLEYDGIKVQTATRIKNLNCKEWNLIFYVCDVEAPQFLEGFNEKYDVIFCLALIGHLKNQDVFLKKLSELCSATLYLEGNYNTNIDYTIDKLRQLGFKTVDAIGFSQDEVNKGNNNRPLFIATK